MDTVRKSSFTRRRKKFKKLKKLKRLKRCYCHYPGGTGVSVNLLVGILEA